MILSTNRIRYGTSGRRAPLVCSRVSIIDQSLSIASFMDLKSMSEHTILIKVTKYQSYYKQSFNGRLSDIAV